MSRNAIKKVFSFLKIAGGVALVVYALAFFTVAACVLDSSRPVADCRQNMAGELVAVSLSPFIRK